MKFTLAWLRRHLQTDATLGRITDTLSAIGLEVEAVQDRGAALAPFRIAQVVSAVPHPNADRLRACQVNAGEGPVSVVCGAPNARAGMKAVFAPPGAVVPGSGMVLKAGDIRGVLSAGMLVSARELGLGDDHAGIIELPEDAPVGAGYAAWAGLDDPMIEIAVTPNRGDALGVRGIARDLAAAGLGRLLALPMPEIAAQGASPIGWANDFPAACPWVLGRAVRGLRNGPSPAWLADLLRAIGLRPINALVDITNFFAFDLGRPLHVFDIGKLSGATLQLRAGAGETLRGLNGRDYIADGEDCVIADAAGVQSFAGIMGGQATGCDDATTDVFIECALFDPVQVALSGRRHQIISDARQRFERGIDPALLPAALDLATAMVQQLCGGAASLVAGAGAEPAWQRQARLRFARLAGLGGMAVPSDAAVAALEGLGFTLARRDADTALFNVPSWRNDIAMKLALDQAPGLPAAAAQDAAQGCAEIEPEADLVEEVLRLRGLDDIPPVSLPRAAAVPAGVLSLAQRQAALARRVLAAQGLAECISFSFMAQDQAAWFAPTDAALRLLNPIAADLDQLRPSPLATLALAAGRNAARGFPDGGLFEIGPGFAVDETGVASGAPIAAGLRCGHTSRRWDSKAQGWSALDAKADALAVLAALGVPGESLNITLDAPDFYHPGQSGSIRQGPKTLLGRFGALHPRVLAGLDMAGPVVGFEIFLPAIPAPKHRRRAGLVLAELQPVHRDFAFLVGSDTPAEAVLRAARGADRALVAQVSLFDIYQGDKLPSGQKSLGVEVVFQPRERTLTDAEIEAACARVVAAVTKATGAVLRG